MDKKVIKKTHTNNISSTGEAAVKPNSMVSFGKLYLTFLWRTPMNLFFIFLFPIFMGLVLAFVMPSAYLFVGMSLLPLILSGTQVVAATVAEWKQTSLIKNIGLSSLTKGQFILTLTIIHLVLGILGSLFVFGILMAFSNLGVYQEVINFKDLAFMTQYYQPTDPINAFLVSAGSAMDFTLKISFQFIYWGQLIVYYLIFGLLSISIGYFIGVISKSISQASMLGIMVALFCSFFSGIYFTPYMVMENSAFNGLSYAIPYRYASFGYFNSWFGFGNGGATSVTSSDGTLLTPDSEMWDWFIGNNPLFVEQYNTFLLENSMGGANNANLLSRPDSFYTSTGAIVNLVGSLSFTTGFFIAGYMLTNFSKRR